MPEFRWMGKEAVENHDVEVAFHLLREESELSVGADDGNLLVEADNLLALKALLPSYRGQVKCIYIDPPYNTGNEGWVHKGENGKSLVGDLAGRGEEFECTQYLDAHPQIETWVRNVPRKPKSFWLQTKTDKFYPDFICRTIKGSYLAIEYKGEAYATNDDSKEKARLGEVWEERSNGACLFAMPQSKQFHTIDVKINNIS